MIMATQHLIDYVKEIEDENCVRKTRNVRFGNKNIAKGTIAYHKKENERKAKIAKFVNNLLHKRGYNYDVKIIRRKKE